MIRFTGRRGTAAAIAATSAVAVGALVLSQAATGNPAVGATSLRIQRAQLAASSDSISSGDACASPDTVQLAPGSFTAQVCAGGSAGSTINPTPRVTVISAPHGLAPEGFPAHCSLDIQLLDANGNVVTDHTTGCATGIQSGGSYSYDGLGADGAPGTGTFTARATLTYQGTTVDLGSSPAYTAGLHQCTGTGTRGILQGGNPASFTFSAGQEVVVQLNSTDAIGTPVSAALGQNINAGDQGVTGISAIGHPFYAKFSQFGSEPMPWTVSISSSLGADIPADSGPVGNGLPGGAGDVGWVVYSNRC